jgi:hypothetical protein
MRRRAFIEWIDGWINEWLNPILAALIAAGYLVWWWLAHVQGG